MGKIVSAISALGKKQIGYAESPLGSNKTKYGILWDTPKSKNGPYPFFNGKKNGACGWCCLYVLWEIAMVLKALLGWDYDKIRVWLGMPKNPADNCGAGAPQLCGYFVNKGWAVSKNKGQSGDLIFFNVKDNKGKTIHGGHVGRIDSVSGGNYKTVEGNHGNKVAYGSYSVNSTKIYKVIHIPYEKIEPKEEEKPIETTPVKPEPVEPVYPKYKVSTKTGEWLALRVAPKLKAVLIVRMDNGSTVELIQTVKGDTFAGSNQWSQVRYTKNGRAYIGYCIKSRLKAI